MRRPRSAAPRPCPTWPAGTSGRSSLRPAGPCSRVIAPESMPPSPPPQGRCHLRSEEHTSELQSHRDLHSFPTRRSSDLWYVRPVVVAAGRALLAGDRAGVDAAIAAAPGPMPFDVALMRTIGARVLGVDSLIPLL